ncbi:MAG: crossover junction endodeoxyribonuclease RuvC [Patescibacteria group bacterium]|nr:crossover junction endodeoxyribonuclease RuvC [Patescibacteria group bacterium]
MVIIGVDPGIAKVGFGVIRKVKSSKLKVKNGLRCLDYGIIQTDHGLPPEQRLKKIYLGLIKLLRKYKPKVLVTEKLYFFKNLKTAIPVSEAKGVILLTAAKKKIKIQQLTPLEVKIGICGYGRAQKKQIQRMTKEILGLSEIPKPDDAADALAIAICWVMGNFKLRGG